MKRQSTNLEQKPNLLRREVEEREKGNPQDEEFKGDESDSAMG